MPHTIQLRFGLLLAFALLLSACSAPAVSPGASTADAGTASLPQSIQIGATIPLTGAFASGGAQVLRGYQYAVEAINQAGGVYLAAYDAHIPLELLVLDDESSPEKVVSNLESLQDAGVIAYLGGFGSSLHAAAAAVAEKNQVPYLGVAFAQYDIHQQGYRYLFSPFFKSPQIATEVFEMLNGLIPEGQRPTRVAIVQEQTDWGIELGGLWADAAPTYGYEIVAHETYAVGTTDFTSLILRIQAAEANAVLTLPNPPDGMTLYRQMAELGYSPEFSLVIRATDNTAWVDNLGSAGDYVLMASGWHHSLAYEGVVALNARHAEDFGTPALPQVGNAYAVIQILADALERAGTLDRQAVRDAIAATDLNTVAGHVVFYADGTSSLSTPLVQLVAGQQQLVWPRQFATADLVYPAPPLGER